MRPRPWMIAILIVILIPSACSSPLVSPPANPPASPTPIPPPTLAPAVPTPPTPEAIPPTQIPAPTKTAIPRLNAQNTFEVIAAIHAYVLIVEEWVGKDISTDERQAVIDPLIEYGLLPMGLLFDQFIPDQQFEIEWQTAAGIHQRFLPGGSIWTSTGDLSALLEAIGPASNEMIRKATSTAADLGMDTSQYGENYTKAIQAASALLSAPGLNLLPEIPEAGELNPLLVPNQITPFVFNFAGSDVFFTIGTLENTSGQPLQDITVEVKYFNFLDEHIATLRGRLLANTANPGSVYPFIATEVISGEETALQQQTRFEAAVFANLADDPSYQAFELEITQISLSGAEVIIEGRLTNAGELSIAAGKIRIGAAAYDEAGILVGVGEGYATAEGILNPDASSPFKLTIQALSGEPASYQLFAESEQDE